MWFIKLLIYNLILNKPIKNVGQKTIRALFLAITLGKVIYNRSVMEENTRVIRPLRLIDLCALSAGIIADMNTIQHCKLIGNNSRVLMLFLDLLGLVGVGIVIYIQRQARGDIEEVAIRDGVLIVETSVELEDLPVYTAAVVLYLLVIDVRFEDGLDLGKPSGLFVGGIWESMLGC